MTTFTAEQATDAAFELAEGILWDDGASLVRWVDIWKGRVLSGRPARRPDRRHRSVEIGQTAGAVALAEDGGLLVAAARGLATISPDGAVSFGPDLLGERREVRLNDGSVDPQGRFVVGTLALGAETGEEVLLRVSPDGTVETLRNGIRLSNGIAFSPDGGTIYHVDTLANTVSSHSYGPGAFDHDEPWALVLTDFPHFPDGLTVSADGTLWVALWGGSSIRHHALTGELLDVVTVDASQASCPAFVGPDLATLGDHHRAGGPRGLDGCLGRDLPRRGRRDRTAGAALVGQHDNPLLAQRQGSTRMRLVRLGPAGSETPGALVDDDTFVDLSDVVCDFDEKFFGSGALAGLADLVAERVAAGRTEPVGDRRFGAPIARPHQILCIGLNYSDHAAETGQAVPPSRSCSRSRPTL